MREKTHIYSIYNTLDNQKGGEKHMYKYRHSMHSHIHAVHTGVNTHRHPLPVPLTKELRTIYCMLEMKEKVKII